MSATQAGFYPPLPATMRGYSTRISASPKFDGLFAYPNGKNIIVRDINDESKTFEYTGHSHQTTVTRISPSGYYGASGDKSGTVHIWDTTKPEHETVHQYKLLGGAVKDLDWDADSKRLIVVGEGAGGSNAAVIMFDSGNTVGHITGHAKAINACSFRSKRPYRAVTGGEDMKAVLHEGPPFKFCNSTDGDHTGFVNDVRFSPNGEWFVTVSADRRIFMYEAKSGSRVREISGSDAESNGHRGAINAVSWSPGSKLIATSSSDGTVKIWDVESGRLVRTINLSKPTVSLSSGSNAVEQQQVGNCWVNEKSIVSVSLSGNLNVLSPDSDTPCRVIIGIQNSVTGAVLTANRCLYVSSYDGKVRMWNFDSDSVLAIPEPATFGDGSYMTHITAIAGSVENDEVAFGALDDKLHLVGKDQGDFNARTVATDSAPVSIAALGGSTFAVVLENKKAVIIADGQVAQEIEPDHATVIASHPALSLLAIGFDDGTFRIYSVSGASAKPTGVEGQPTQRQVTALAFSPSGEVLATGDAGGKVVPVNTADGTSLTPRWVFHTARITSLSWSPDGAHLASSSLDRHIAVWNKDQLGKVVRIRHTHTEGVGYVAFLSVDSLVSVGYDSGIKTWKLAL